MIGSIRPETRDGPVRLMTITLLKTSTSFFHHPGPSLMPQSCSLPLDVGVSTGVWPKRVHVLVLVGVFSFANPAGNTAVLNYYKRTKKRFLLGVLRVFLALNCYFPDLSTHLHPAQQVPVPMPHGETSSVGTDCEAEIRTANTARRFCHAMPTAVNTRAKKLQASTPDYIVLLPYVRTSSASTLTKHLFCI